jgi:hypothetical protein
MKPLGANSWLVMSSPALLYALSPTPLDHQRFGKGLAVGDVAAALDMHAAHAEVAQLVFVADPDDARHVAHAGLAQNMIHVVDIFERGALAGAHAVARADDDGFAFAGFQGVDDVLEFCIGFQRVTCGAHGYRMAVFRTQPGGRAKIQFRPGGIHQVIVSDFFLHTGLARTRVFDGHERGRNFGIAFRIDRQCLGLAKIHPGLAVYLGQVEGDFFLFHLPDTHPDIGGYPVPFGVG